VPVKIIIDISDARVSNHNQDTLITYSLGSCIGVSLYDPNNKVGGMLHFQLPSAKIDKSGQYKNPLMYADTGMEALIKKMETMGAQKKRMNVKIAGGAQMMNDAKMFNIGKRNYAAIRQFLWKNGMFIDAEDCGGGAARTLSMDIADGEVVVKSKGQTKKL